MKADSMNIEHVPIDSIRTDERNVRKHNKRNLDGIKRSLEAFGQQKPIVVGADGVVVAGNGTLDAARALGWTHIDVVHTKLKGSARKAYAVADNRTAETAEWDESGLGELLTSLQEDVDFDETVTGFDAAEIEAMVSGPQLGPEIGESIADGMSMCTCPVCSHEHAKTAK